ncbi:hypothetical protein WISP_141931 [Willisornis vidua]|uniref:Reverse transcriptase domain-containing protein n=1 Tax=Willisornis vidua TaxID=1566151 RepID=A0ABQ9CMT9_9PASS|nr:hypothetical protein WISP_141931 [Willisornis vidua]
MNGHVLVSLASLQIRKTQSNWTTEQAPAEVTPGKVMEQLILKAISIQMDDKKMIRSSQHGFIKEKPCLTNLIAFYNRTTTWIDEGRAVNIVYLNFSKAFNRDRCLLSKFKDDTKLGGVANIPEVCAVLQKDLDRLEGSTEQECLKLNKGECKVLQQGRNNPRHQVKLGADLLESSSVEKDLGVLVDNKLSMSQLCTCVAKKDNAVLGCIRESAASRLKGLIVPLYCALVRPHLKCCIQSWTPQYKRDREPLEQVGHRATEMMTALEDLFYEERLRKLGLFCLERRLRGDLINGCKYHPYRLGCQETGTRLVLVVLSNKTRGNRKKLMQRKYQKNMKKNFFTGQVTERWNKWRN